MVELQQGNGWTDRNVQSLKGAAAQILFDAEQWHGLVHRYCGTQTPLREKVLIKLATVGKMNNVYLWRRMNTQFFKIAIVFEWFKNAANLLALFKKLFTFLSLYKKVKLQAVTWVNEKCFKVRFPSRAFAIDSMTGFVHFSCVFGEIRLPKFINREVVIR